MLNPGFYIVIPTQSEKIQILTFMIYVHPSKTHFSYINYMNRIDLDSTSSMSKDAIPLFILNENNLYIYLGHSLKQAIITLDLRECREQAKYTAVNDVIKHTAVAPELFVPTSDAHSVNANTDVIDFRQLRASKSAVKTMNQPEPPPAPKPVSRHPTIDSILTTLAAK